MSCPVSSPTAVPQHVCGESPLGWVVQSRDEEGGPHHIAWGQPANLNYELV